MKHLLLIFTTAVTLFSCSPSMETDPQRVAKGDVQLGGMLRLAEAERPAGLSPNELTTASLQRIGNQVHCGLLRLDPVTLQPTPAIAERVEPDTSGKIYIFHLRHGVMFHDEPCFGNNSREVTAHDVVFSFKQLCKAGSAAYSSTFNGRVEGVEAFNAGTAQEISGIMALDDYTLRISLTKADESFLFVLAQPTASIISQKAWEDCGQLSIGAGPFRPADAEDTTLLFIRHQDYFANDAFGNRLPYIDSVQMSFISTKELALEAVLQGELDLVTGIYLDPVKDLMERHAAEFTGKEPRLVMQRNDDVAAYEVYSIYASKLIGFKENFLGYRDFATLQIKK